MTPGQHGADIYTDGLHYIPIGDVTNMLLPHDVIKIVFAFVPYKDITRWMMVDIEPITPLEIIGLPELKANPALEGMPLLARGQRLSVQPVSGEHFGIVCSMGGTDSSTI